MTNKSKGLLFDIQRFSVNDGPGIRTTLFFKGCSLRCPWCHNPESISPKQQLKFDQKKCVLCKKCIEFVNGDGISVENDKLLIDFDKHGSNFSLIDVCPCKAYGIFGTYYTVDEIVDVVLKDREYYENSNGGVTFSGGEAINQIDFLCELGSALKKHNIHLCTDVSGFGRLETFKRTLEFTDIYLLDYKLTNKSDYKPILAQDFNVDDIIQLFEENNKSVILRCPIIPTVNDSEEHFKAIATYSNKYQCISYVDILPYHNLVKNYKFKYVNKPKRYTVPEEQTKLEWIKWLKKYQAIKIVMENQNI